MTERNLDRLCAHFGYEMCQSASQPFAGKKSDTENLITKSLGVLQEDGVYAFYLYISSQIKDEGDKEKSASKAARALANKSIEFLAHEDLSLLPQNCGNDYKRAMESIRKPGGLADNLDNLLLAKRLLEQALIYARYHAKALEETK
jgi:hypothetical protein